tara:strand:- start:94 stop:327 length:234 start_codon:yes stop_codon:yes gene_type:complete
MENLNNINKKQIVKFDDSEYIIDELPEEAKGLISGLKTADLQIKMHEDTLRLISIGKSKMIEELKVILEKIRPINDA